MEQAHAVSPVYFISVTDEDSPESIRNSFSKLLKHSPFLTEIEHDTKAVVKLHFGEEGNTGYVKPLWVRVLCDVVQERGGTVVVSDTNTLYRGRRLDSADHLALAREHGFTQENLGCDCVIAGETNPDDTVTVPINQKHISDAKIARLYHDAGLLIGVAHFKGHVMCGFGGALKNIGMGCATREGKLAQHSSVSPEIDAAQCVACGSCVESCPVDAITIPENTAVLNAETCIGCGTCLAVCDYGAIDVPWDMGASTIQQKMVEYASAVTKSVPKAFYVNFAVKITKECDCLAKDDPKLVPDIGILASPDPVALDQACYDLTTEKAGKDIFKEVHPARDGLRQLFHAEEIGIGSRKYELIEVG